MIKAAIDRVLELARPITVAVGGRSYSTVGLNHIVEPNPAPLAIRTLTGLVDYIESADQDFIEKGGNFHVQRHDSVAFISNLFGPFVQRNVFIESSLSGLTGYPFGSFLDVETFIISLQAHFVQDETTAALLRLVSNLRDEKVNTFADDGVSQQVTAKVGLARVEDVPVPNPVTLRPYRTFLEVEQPVSQFVFRMQPGGTNSLPKMALFEADGGRWKLEAIANIRAYLRDALPDIPVIA